MGRSKQGALELGVACSFSRNEEHVYLFRGTGSREQAFLDVDDVFLLSEAFLVGACLN